MITSALMLGALAPGAHAAYVIDSDARPKVVANKIVTDAFDDASGTLVNDVRYFGYRFQTDPEDPYFTQDPGFNAPAGSGLPAGSQLSFNVVRHLAYWDGSDAVSFVKPPNGESLQLNFGAANVFITGNTNQLNGFAFANVAADGSTHRHLNAFLHGFDANTDPTAGIYFTNLRLRSSDAGINQSDSLYIIYNNGLAPTQFNAALSYLNNPFPGDANFDGFVNASDFTALASSFGTTGKFWYEGDFNGDYIVNASDFTILASHFGQTAPGSTVASVPEPTTLFTSVCAIGALARRRRIQDYKFNTHSFGERK